MIDDDQWAADLESGMMIAAAVVFVPLVVFGATLCAALWLLGWIARKACALIIGSGE